MIDHPIDVDLLIVDVDGTLRKCIVAGQLYPYQSDQWQLLPNVERVLQNYSLRYWHPQQPAGTVELALVSNQPGVSLGYLTDDMAGLLLWQTLAATLREPWPHLAVILTPQWQTPGLHATRFGLSVRWCGTHPDVPDMRRLPNPAMLWEAMTDHGVLPDRTLLVGNCVEAEQAAERANVPFMWASTFFGWEVAS